MKFSMAQMKIEKEISLNEKKSLLFIERAKKSDFLMFPEGMYSPVLLSENKKNTDASGLLKRNSAEIFRLTRAAYNNNIYISPNLYISENENIYDMSFVISRAGIIESISSKIQCAGDMYTKKSSASEVYSSSLASSPLAAVLSNEIIMSETEIGKIGVAMHLDLNCIEKIKKCAALGSKLIIIPTANEECKEYTDLKTYMRQLAAEYYVNIAICNRTGINNGVLYAGKSVIYSQTGSIVAESDNNERIIEAEISLL